MPQTWGPTSPGKLFTSTKPWSLALDQHHFALEVDGRRHSGSVLLLDRMVVSPGAFWASVRVEGVNGQAIVLDGIPNDAAKQMQEAVAASIAVIRRQQHIAELIRQFEPEAQRVKAWVANAKEACSQQLRRRGWLSYEFTSEFAASKPTGLEKLLAVQEVQQHLARQDEVTKDAVAAWRRSFTEVADGINKRHLAKELIDARRFFDTVEKSPLTPEQAEAVITFDNRVLLVASAGSGKTSTMVAKAGYALQRGYFAPERMLLLAFNNDAAAELRERIKARLEPLGLPADRVVAKTFHAFGLDVIGAATGKKPSLASWVETGRDLEAILEMVDGLKDSDPLFRASWDRFRLVFGQDLPKFGKEQENPEAWDRDSGRNGFWTLQGDVVKSRGEQVIANWLFYNGVA